MKEKIEFAKLREFSDLIGDTLVFIKQNFKSLTKMVFGFCGLFMIAGIVSMVMLKIQVSNAAYSQVNSFSTRMGFLLSWQYALSSLVGMLNFTTMSVVVYSYIAIYNAKGKLAPTFDELWTYFKHYFFRIFGSSILWVVLLTVVWGVLIGPGILLLANGSASAGGVMAIMLGFVIGGLATAYIFPMMSVFYSIMVFENGSFGYAFNRAFKLVKGEWWISFAVLFIIYIITLLCFYVTLIPAGILEMLNTIAHIGTPINKTYAIISAISTYIAYIFWIIPMICSSLMYFNLVERKENRGLMSRMESLGNQTYTPPTESIPEEY